MKKRQHSVSPPFFGGSSLLVIFGVLCLVVFALLSLGTVTAQRRLTDSALAAVSDYYAADLEAERVFARLRAGETPEGVTATEAGYAYQCPISEHQTLCVELARDADGWTVLRWQAVAIPPAIDDSLPVYTGQEGGSK